MHVLYHPPFTAVGVLSPLEGVPLEPRELLSKTLGY